MYDGKRILAVIPARGGSRAIPRKNIKPLAGLPLLAHAILRAREVPELDCVVVSTEDEEIKTVAKSYEARIIDRPQRLAGDKTPTEPVLLHALEVLSSEGEGGFDYVAVLEPTTPLRRSSTVTACIRRIIDADAQSLLTVREIRNIIGRIDGSGCFRSIEPDAPRRRQDRRPYYVECGAVYVCCTDLLRNEGSLVAADWLAHIVDEEEAMDINTPFELAVAETMMRKGASEQ